MRPTTRWTAMCWKGFNSRTDRHIPYLSTQFPSDIRRALVGLGVSNG
jgi:hypothetical protein